MYGPHISEIFSGIFPAEKTVGLEKRKSQQFNLFPFFFLVSAVGWNLVSLNELTNISWIIITRVQQIQALKIKQ